MAIRMSTDSQELLVEHTVTRRDFLAFCSLMAGALALPKSSEELIRKALASPKRTPVIWLGITGLRRMQRSISTFIQPDSG